MNSKKIYIDPRWVKAGGIGTFYENINKINNYNHINIHGMPYNPIDCYYSSKAASQINDAIIYFPGYIPPLYSKNVFVFTIHDLNHLDREENSSFTKKIFYNTVIKNGCRKASYIFTVSDFSRRRIIEWSGVDEGKVINVGNGVSEDFSQNGERLILDYDYILCVSNRKGHKNELGTLMSFYRADIDPKIKLVFTGYPNALLQRKIDELQINQRVIFTGYLAESDLPKLYRSAIALVFVSFYEGFGLPIIEAQASGIPVITSYGTSLEEVSGKAAYLVEPTDIDDISTGIAEVCNNHQLRATLITDGLNNSKRYNWKYTAKLVDEYLNRLK